VLGPTRVYEDSPIRNREGLLAWQALAGFILAGIVQLALGIGLYLALTAGSRLMRGVGGKLKCVEVEAGRTGLDGKRVQKKQQY
jgi:hypothetical protein